MDATQILATPKQVAFAKKLLAERQLPEGFSADEIQADIENSSIQRASKWIDRLLTLPYSAKPKPFDKAAAVADGVPAGRYALQTDDGVRFYKVDRPTEGRWAGRVFVNIQAGDDRFPLRGAGAIKVLVKIAEDPKEASARYGHEIGCCGVCGRTLTNPDSIAAGIGPVCLENVGW